MSSLFDPDILKTSHLQLVDSIYSIGALEAKYLVAIHYVGFTMSLFTIEQLELIRRLRATGISTDLVIEVFAFLVELHMLVVDARNPFDLNDHDISPCI